MPILHPDHLTESCRNLFEGRPGPRSGGRRRRRPPGRGEPARPRFPRRHQGAAVPEGDRGRRGGARGRGRGPRRKPRPRPPSTATGGSARSWPARATEVCIAKARQCGLAAVTRPPQLPHRPARGLRRGDGPAGADRPVDGQRPWPRGPSSPRGGGAEGRLATNPVAVGIPTGDPQAPIVLDMTTSAVAEGKVRVRLNSGEPVPDGWMLDRDGQPTNDPADLYTEPRGTILPFGGVGGPQGVRARGDRRPARGGPQRRRDNGASSGAPRQRLLPAGPRRGPVPPVRGFRRRSRRLRPLPEVDAADGRLRGGCWSRGRSSAGQSASRGGEIAVDEETWRQIAACAQKLGVGIEPGT